MGGYKSLGAIDLWGIASFDPSGLIGRIYGKSCISSYSKK